MSDDRPRSWPTWPTPRWRRRWPSPAPSVGRTRRAVPARRHRDGQVRRPRAQLHLRRRRHLRRRAGRRRRRGERGRAIGHATWPQRLMRAPVAATAEGSIWEVDAGAAAGGQGRRAGAHPRQPRRPTTERWAKTWEFQALLKARPVAGDLDARRGATSTPWRRWCGRRPTARTSSTTCRRCAGASSSTSRRKRGRPPAQARARRAARRRVLGAAAAARARPQRRHAAQRPTTLDALEALATWGYVGRDDAAELGDAYRFLRTLEHRMQLHRLRRTHLVPDGEADLRRARRARWAIAQRPGRASSPTQWRAPRAARSAGCTRSSSTGRCCNAVARLDAGEARLTPEAAAGAAARRWATRDPAGALRHLEALDRAASAGGPPSSARCCR